MWLSRVARRALLSFYCIQYILYVYDMLEAMDSVLFLHMFLSASVRSYCLLLHFFVVVYDGSYTCALYDIPYSVLQYYNSMICFLFLAVVLNPRLMACVIR